MPMPIKELPEKVASKIAAGEVVERPVSVVKELIENSIDAGALNIIVRVLDAGKRLIEVKDDGSGIPQAEVLTAVKRYATSKIATIDDLDHISTLGFRGEALASISSVSRMRINTRVSEELAGITLNLEGGQEVSQLRTGNPIGTTIRIEDLFFNVPARKKFLKSDITERRLISELISEYALIYPSISFRLEMEGKNLIQSSGNGNQREVLSLIYDLKTTKQLLEVNFRKDDIQVKGFISPIGITRSNRKEIHFSINGRRINNSILISAVIRAFHGYLMVGRFPIANLFISLPVDQYDVNVHPAKAEIKFRDEKKVFSAVHSAVRKTIAAYFPVPELPGNLWDYEKRDSSADIDRKNIQGNFIISTFSNKEDSIPENSQLQNKESTPSILRLIGQLGQTYIAAEGPDGLYLIDQHAAHERILYEELLGQQHRKPTSQLLLVPSIVEISPGLEEILKSRQPVLESIGFTWEDFGPNTIKITAIPLLLVHMNPEEALMSSIEPDEDDKEFIDRKIEAQIIAKICKKAAVKGGQILSRFEQEELLRNLEACQSPRTCPHGRPTMIYLSVGTLEKQFGRHGSI